MNTLHFSTPMVIGLITLFTYMMDHALTVSADSKIPSGQNIGAMQRDYEWQKRNDMIKRKLTQRKKKSKIENKENKQLLLPQETVSAKQRSENA